MPTFAFRGRAGNYTYSLARGAVRPGLPFQADIFAAGNAANPQPIFIEETRSLRGSISYILRQWRIAQKDHGASLFYIHCVPRQAMRQEEKDDLVAEHQPVMNSAKEPGAN